MVRPSRHLVCILGLPFDVVSLPEAVDRVRQSVRTRESCFISTPNVNFVVQARADPAFRRSVLHSDLVLADGMPIVWVSRLLGLPLRERVAGSDLFEALAERSDGPPVKVYFFGGPDGAAQAACDALALRGGGLVPVGGCSPGFVTLDEMSTDAYMDQINRADPDMVVVSLGARKGQAWIERNRHRLRAPVISHLGAVVNFVAGSVRRAPAWMRWVGLEWLWRVGQEPALWKRYGGDGVALAAMVLREVLPMAMGRMWRRWSGRKVQSGRVFQEERGSEGIWLSADGDLSDESREMILSAAHQAAANGRTVVLDMGGHRASLTILGHLLVLDGYLRDQGLELRVVNARGAARRYLSPLVRPGSP